MAIQTLNTIKNWFKTTLKPSQQQFWDTWDSFRHKLDKVPVKEVEGIDELLNTKADKIALNDHIADINAHAPQVNTDWNSESGFSQLLNKPDFKTINGESILGNGDLVIDNGGSQNLQQVLDTGNSANIRTYNNVQLMEGSDLYRTTSFTIGENYDELGRLTINRNGIYIQNYSADDTTATIEAFNGKIKLSEQSRNGNIRLELANATEPNIVYTLANKPQGNYTIATLDDIAGSPVSATQPGFVNNIELQELGGTDKKINGIRIGKGNANYENNLVIGRNGLASVTTGQYNVAIGNGDWDVEGPLQYLTTGNNNTMIGSDAGVANTTGTNNTGIGAASLFKNTTANSNTAIGAFALSANVTSPFNVAIGSNTLSKMTSGLGQSTAIGAFCMYNATATDKNAAIGTYALRYNTSGFSNTAIGHTALGLNTSGHSNNAVGNYSLSAITTGYGNNGFGKFAGRYVTTGNFNIYIGAEGLPEDATTDNIINIGNRFVARGPKMSLIGTLNIQTVPVYEDNISALASGLTRGDVYRTSSGILMITY